MIDVQHVTKRYGTLAAVDDVTLQVRPGEVYALLGLNGAGKTTLIRMALGMVRPTAGSVAVAGRAVCDRPDWAQVGYLVESPSAYPDLTVRENLEVVRRLRRLPATGNPVQVALDRFGLVPYAGTRARTLSLGNAQRLGLAKAMLHRPAVVVLDEPVNGLDPAGVVEMREMLVALARDDGATVLLSSHLLSEVARVATRIGVLHQGRLVDELDSRDVQERLHRRLEVGARDLTGAAETLTRAGYRFHQVGGLLVTEGSRALGRPDGVAMALAGDGNPPTRLAVVEEDLEGYFLRLVGRPEGRLAEP